MIRNLKNLIELFAYLYCLAELFGRKLKISIHAVVLVILIMFLMVGLDNYGFPEYLSSLAFVGMFLYGLLYYGENVKLTLVNCFLAYVIVVVLQLIMFLPLYYLYYTKYEYIDMNELLVNIVSFFIIILCSYKINLKRLSDFCIRKNKLIVGVALFIIFGFAFNYYQMKEEGIILTEVYIQMVYFILIFLFVIYEWQKSKVDAERKKAQLEMNRLYYDAYDRLIMLVRERQHDMKNHINTILSLIYTTDNYDDLTAKQREYCGYVMEQNEKTKLVLSTGNPLIAGFMYSKIQEAEENDIKVDYQIEIKKDTAIIPEYELVEMMGILVDNAIDALINSDEEAKDENQIRKMYFSIKDTEECVEIIVANTSNRYEEGMTERFFEAGYSSKGKGRGIGLSKLKRMVNERKGEIIVSNDVRDGRNNLTFTVTIPKISRSSHGLMKNMK